MLSMDMKTCPKCAVPHSKPGTFCSRACANFRVHSEETKQKIAKKNKETAIGREFPRKTAWEYVCESCRKPFASPSRIRPERYKHCENCKLGQKKLADIEKVSSILELSTRTASKILKRLGAGCVLCGWNRTSLDIHHIHPTHLGGTDEHSNLITLCPNCHRLAHENQIDQKVMLEHSMEAMFPKWKEHYNTE